MVSRFEQWTMKAGKNRDHPDLVAADGDVGQRGDEGFVVLRDPEGNEFCLLRRS